MSIDGSLLGEDSPLPWESHPSGQTPCFSLLSYPSQPHSSVPFLAGQGQVRDDRQERRSCCGKISALPFCGTWTKSWDNRVQDLLSKFFSFFPSAFARVCIPYCAVLFRGVCAASCLRFGQRGFHPVECCFSLLQISRTQRPLLSITHCWFYSAVSGFGRFRGCQYPVCLMLQCSESRSL